MKKRFVTFMWIALLTGILFTGCSTAPVRYRKFSGLNEHVEKALSLNEVDYPDVNGVVVRSFEDVNITTLRGIGLETFRKVHRVQRIFKDPERYSSITIFLSPEDRISSLSARVISPDGEIKDLDEKDIYSYKMVREIMGTTRESRSVRFNLPWVKEGSVIEYSYTVVYRDFFFSNRWNLSWYKMDVLDSEVIVRIPNWLFDTEPKWSLRYKVYNYPDMPDPEIKKGIGQYGDTVYRFRVKDIPAYEPEPFMTHSDTLRPHVRAYFGRFNNPGQYARWFYNNQIRGQLIITDKIEKLAHEITEGAETELEKIEKVKNFVEQLHYNSDHTEFGHAIKPNTPEVVLRRGFGDCKDKSVLLVALLKVLEIDSDPVLVRTRGFGDIDTDMPYGVFNHMIVRVNTQDGISVWIDPVVSGIGLGRIPWSISGIWGLVIKEKGGNYMVRLPEAVADQNGAIANTAINISDDLTVTYNIEVVYRGNNALSMSNYFKNLTDRDMHGYVKDKIGEDFIDARIKNVSVSKSEDNSVFKLKFTIISQSILRKRGEEIYSFPMKPWGLRAFPYWGNLWLKERVSPFRLGNELINGHTVTISLPEDMVVKNPEFSKSFSMPEDLLTYSGELKSDEGKIYYTERQVINRYYAQPQYYGQLRDFAQLYTRTTRNWIMIGKKSIPVPAPMEKDVYGVGEYGEYDETEDVSYELLEEDSEEPEESEE